MGGVGRAFGKLILFGEHAAVYGHPAVGTSLPEQTTVTLAGSSSLEWRLGAIAPEDRGSIRQVLARLEESLPDFASRGRCAVTIESDVTRKAGFGSSSALCGACARAALAHAGLDAGRGDDTRAWTLAHEAERLFHGTPSGVDTGLSMLGGTHVLDPHPPGLPGHRRVPSCGLWLVVGALPRDAACAELVGNLALRVKSGDAAARASIDELGGIAADAAGCLLSGKEMPRSTVAADRLPQAIGALADRAMRRLRALGLSTRDLDLLLYTAGNEGARGGKLSGAGGGGAFYAVADDRQAGVRIASRLGIEAEKAGIMFSSPLRIIEI
jgi:mevalonate kinase